MKKFLLSLIVAFAFSGSIFAQTTHWPEYNDGDFEDNSTIIAFVKIDGEFVGHTDNWADLEVGSFVGDEIRGMYFMNSYPEDDPHAILESFVAWNAEGETVTFKMYDHANGILYEDCTTNFEVLTGEDHTELYFDPEQALVISFTTPEMDYPPYPWIPSTAYSGEGMTVTAQIRINGQLVDRDSYEVGAFCGFECRSSSYYPGNDPLVDLGEDGYFAFLNVFGNDGDIINFYLYDHENDQVFEGVCNTTVTLENGAEIGTDIDNDLFVLNFVTMTGITKDIVGYENEGGGYYLIASPVGEVNPDNVDMMKSNTYDLYWFKQDGDTEGKEWMNYKTESFSLVPGKGYLYANSDDVTLTFPGNAYEGTSLNVPLDYVADCDFPGMNLVGNPFNATAYIGGRDFYVMNNDEIVPATTNEIAPMEGIFVCAEAEGESVTFSTEGGKKVSHLALNLVNSNKLVDRAIVNFDETQQLPKFQLNANSTKLYFPMSDKDYAVVSCQDMGELPLNFKAEKSGSYTIAINSEEVSFGYLHLIDNLTGTDTDLLANPSYSFEASTSDYASRFKLVFATGNNDNDDNFAYYSNGTWVINNDGKANVQVVDVTGRILSNEQIEGCYSLNFNAAPGVYMIRLVNGDNVKVQKVVVK